MTIYRAVVLVLLLFFSAGLRAESDQSNPCESIDIEDLDVLNAYLEHSRRTDELVLGARASQSLWRAEGEMATDPTDAFELLSRAYSIAPRNELVLRSIAQACHTEHASLSDLCEINASEALVQVNPDRAVYWMMYGSQKYGASDSRGAKQAFKRASYSQDFSIGYLEDWRTFNNVVDVFTRAMGQERKRLCLAAIATGHASMGLPDYSNLTRACRDMVGQDAEWRDVCLRIGERMEADGQVLIAVMLGLAVQSIAYEESGEDVPPELGRRLQEFDELRHKAAEYSWCENNTDEGLARWQSELMTYGELGMIQRQVKRGPVCPPPPWLEAD